MSVCQSVQAKKGEKAEKVKAPKKGSVPQHPRRDARNDFPCGFPQGFLRRSQRNKRQRQIRTGVLPHLSIEKTSFCLLNLSPWSRPHHFLGSILLARYKTQWIEGKKYSKPAVLASNRGCKSGLKRMHHTDGFSKEEDDWELLDDEELIRALGVGGCLKIWTKAI
jgi:hypothetical protein